jgi:uncharacterized protein YjbI with pentapeptide repeats
MGEQRTETGGSERSVPEGYTSWPSFWQAVGMPWRIEPEIPHERRLVLAARWATEPDPSRGKYPFKGARLDRADVEWLLATHESDGICGPVDWNEKNQRTREGLDLRGADLRNADLHGLPLARLRGGVAWAQEEESAIPNRTLRHAPGAHLEDADLTGAHLEFANLDRAYLAGADLRDAHLEGAYVNTAHLGNTNLTRAFLQGAFLESVYLDRAVALDHATLYDSEYGGIYLADARLADANLGTVQWSHVKALGEEQLARHRVPRDGRSHGRYGQTRLDEYEVAVRANRQLATALRDQGLGEYADKFASRAQVLQRQVYLRKLQLRRYLGSLFLDWVSGYGYRPLRSVATYVVAIASFAALYWCVTNNVFVTFGLFTNVVNWLGMASPPPPLQHLEGYEAVVLSMSSFHGRGFYWPTQSPGDKVAILGAIEATIGLLIEVTFIATFTQRFFAR